MTQDHPTAASAPAEAAEAPGSDVMQRVADALEATEAGAAPTITRAADTGAAPLPPRRR